MANRSKGRFISSSKSPRPSGSKANVTGYAMRQARKTKSTHGLSSDVYEYAPEVLRRSKVTLNLDQAEATEHRVGMEEGNDESREELRARLIGENGENEQIESGDDEELDSDAAFEESDEERFAGFFSKKACICHSPHMPE
jgi:U3 small nucleolar RNA-associated protein 14